MNTPMDHDLSLLAQMRQGVNQYHFIQVRGARIKVRPLSCAETVEITAQAADDISRMPQNYQNRISEEVQLAKLKLSRASTSDVDKNDPTLTDYILNKMTVHEILALFKSYSQWLDSIDPSVEEMPVATVVELAEQIKKNPSQLTELSRWELLNLARYSLTKEG